MGKLLTALKRLPKRTSAAVAVLVAAVAIPAGLFAWGPSRATYTVAHPADKVVFNSIIDNPHIGDERNFVNVRDAAITTDGGWQDTVNVEPGKEYLVRVYVHNNANANLNLKAINTRVKASVPTTTGKNVSVSGFVSADNADPQVVWDDIHFNGAQDFNLAYVPGSAEIFNNATGPGGKKLSDSIVTSTGAPVSYTEEGVIPGCFQFASYVYFKVKPQFAPQANFEVQKTVRKSGDKDFVESVAVKPGDKVDYQIYYKNTGEQQMKNVVVRDVLPAGMTYVAGTTWLHNSSGTRQVADGITTNGLDIGGYMPNGDAYLKFTAQVAGNDTLPTCGPNTLHNVAKVETDYGTKQDSADVTVPKECQPEVSYKCDSLTVDKIERTKFKFTTATSQQNATFKKVTYIVRNAQGMEVDRKESTAKTLDYSRTEVGKYTVEAQVTFTVNGQDKVVSSTDCKKPFEVLKENECKPGIPVGDNRCKEECKPGVPMGDQRCNECKPGVPVGDEKCNETPCVPSTANNNCGQTPPQTPPELPHTGSSDGILAIIGAGSLIASIGYYIASRRQVIG